MEQLIPKEFTQQLQLIQITCIKLSKKKGQLIMKSLQEFTDNYYQKYNLDYLRKIRPFEKQSEDILYVLCLQKDYNQNYIQENNLSQKLEELSPYEIVQNIDVPKYEALNKKQMEEWNKYWPTKFSDKEKQYKTNLNKKEIQNAQQYFNQVINLTQQSHKNGNQLQACLLVDPKKNIVLTQSEDNTQQDQYSIQHCVMETMKQFGQLMLNQKQLVQNQEAIQNQQIQENSQEQNINQDCQNKELSQNLNIKRKNSKDISAILKEEQLQKQRQQQIQGTEEYNDYYFASNLDLYIFSEPCIMCSMALIHSRIRRVFIIKQHSDPKQGGIFENEIYNLKSLNHKFSVFVNTDKQINEKIQQIMLQCGLNR